MLNIFKLKQGLRGGEFLGETLKMKHDWGWGHNYGLGPLICSRHMTWRQWSKMLCVEEHRWKWDILHNRFIWPRHKWGVPHMLKRHRNKTNRNSVSKANTELVDMGNARQIHTHLIIKNTVLAQVLAKQRVAIAGGPSHGARRVFVMYAPGWGGRRGEFWKEKKDLKKHKRLLKSNRRRINRTENRPDSLYSESESD